MSLYKIVYEGKDITRNLSEILINLEYNDRLEGKAGDICIELEDHGMKFAGPWYPQTDDKIELWIQDQYCGAFWVDECNSQGDKSNIMMTIRAMSVRMNAITQGGKHKHYKGVLLRDLAKSVAASLNLAIKGKIEGTIKDNCVDMNDLQFLSDQATKLGYIMKLDSGSIVFSKYADLKAQKSIVISRKDVTSWDIKDKAIGKYIKCTCKWYDEKKKKSYHGIATVKGIGGEANIWEEVESNEDALKRAQDWLEDKNKQKADIEITNVGDMRLLAGVHVDARDFGKHDGSYVVSGSTHTIDRGNHYITKVKLNL